MLLLSCPFSLNGYGSLSRRRLALSLRCCFSYSLLVIVLSVVEGQHQAVDVVVVGLRFLLVFEMT